MERLCKEPSRGKATQSTPPTSECRLRASALQTTAFRSGIFAGAAGARRSTDLRNGNRVKGHRQKTAPEDETGESNPRGRTRGCLAIGPEVQDTPACQRGLGKDQKGKAGRTGEKRLLEASRYSFENLKTCPNEEGRKSGRLNVEGTRSRTKSGRTICKQH